MHIAVCDSSRLSQVLFINALRECDPEQHTECFTNGKELLKAMRERPVFDIVFLDVYFPGESGLDIAAKLRSLSPETGIVFVTNSQDHAVEAWALDALNYLIKPITTEGIRESFQRLKSTFPKEHPRMRVNIGKDSHTVYLEEIICIYSSRHAKEIHLTGNHVIRVWMELRNLEEKLDARFLKINRGVIANMEHIRRMTEEYCLLDDGTRLDFSRQKKETIRKAWEDYLLLRMSGKNQQNQ
ncbi:MAG: LytTR family DNA-binding domain-containing protein [Lachnospiraceae bacterium]|nr:LytTR family DNA-binding domain-containing protein [Lachnospiraceae bacterium]